MEERVVVAGSLGKTCQQRFLGEIEPGDAGRWRTDGSELTSAVKFLDAAERPAASRLEPDAVAAELRAVLIGQAAEAQHATQAKA